MADTEALGMFILSLCVGVLAAIVAVFTSRVTSKLDSIVGGVLSTIPSAIIPASIGFVVADDHIDVVEALYAIPSGIILNAFFLSIWRKLPSFLTIRFGYSINLVLLLTIIISVLVWITGSTILFFSLHALPLLYKRVAAGISVFVMLVYGIVITRLQPNPSPHNQCSIQFTSLYIVLGILSMITTGSSVALSLESEILGGLCASFPSAFLVSMISHWLYTDQVHTPGKEMSTTATSSVYISPHILGSISISAYCIMFAACYEFQFFNGALGAAFSTSMSVLISWLISVIGISIPIILGLKFTKRNAENNLSMVRFAGDQGTPLLQFLDDYDDHSIN